MLINRKYSRTDIVVSCLLILAFAAKLLRIMSLDIFKFTLDSWGYSEFLINFQGGFVRRGLFGELLFWLHSLTGVPVKGLLFVLSYAIFALVVIFFFRKFREKRYCWWLLLSPFFLSFTAYIVRKDYLLYALLIFIIYRLSKSSPSVMRKLTAFLILILGLFLHEAFIFFGFPVYALLLLTDKRNRALNIALVLLPVFAFFGLCVFKGDWATSQAIVDSWNTELQSQTLTCEAGNSIGAIGWDAVGTFRYHFRTNVGSGGVGIVLIPLMLLAAFYLFTNFFQVFSPGSLRPGEDAGAAIGMLYVMSVICLLPMLTVLSCDVGRVFQYASMATFTAFLILSYDRVVNMFPQWYRRAVDSFRNRLNAFLPPSRGLLILILLFAAIGITGVSFESNWRQSVIGGLWYGITCIAEKFI